MPTPSYVDPQNVLDPQVGEPLSAAWCDQVRNNLEFLARSPGCIVRAPDQTIAHNSFVNLQFTDPDWRDTDGYHDPASSPEKIVIPPGFGGLYQVTGAVRFAVSASGRRQWVLFVNGVDTAWTHRSMAVTDGGSPTSVLVTAEVELSAGDELTFRVVQTSGGPLDVSALIAVRLVALS